MRNFPGTSRATRPLIGWMGRSWNSHVRFKNADGDKGWKSLAHFGLSHKKIALDVQGMADRALFIVYAYACHVTDLL